MTQLRLASIGVLAVFSLFVAAAVPAAADSPPTTTPIKHFVVLMQENHTFDNYFGTYPGANGLRSQHLHAR